MGNLIGYHLFDVKAGDREAKECGTQKKEPPVTKTDLDINKKLNRAAVTALSAAAVKAKLLADQEEDQILQLSTLLIEKQVILPLTSYIPYNPLLVDLEGRKQT